MPGRRACGILSLASGSPSLAAWLVAFLTFFTGIQPAWAQPSSGAAPSTLKQASADSEAPASGCAARIDFVKRPYAQRVWTENEFGAPYILAVLTDVVVRDSDGKPCSDVSVTLEAVSAAGTGATGRARTDAKGKAHIRAVFELPAGSLRIRAETFLTHNTRISAPQTYLSLRDRATFSLSFDFGGVFAPLPPPARDQHMIDIAGTAVSAARFEIHPFEREEHFRYSRLSLYGTVPFVAVGRGVESLDSYGASFQPVDSRWGMGDFAAGINLNLFGNAVFDVSYNGRSGKVNLVDSIRNLGNPRLVNLGDGFESIDASLQLNKRLGKSRAHVFAQGYNSRAFERHFSDGSKAERGDFSQVVVGIGRTIGRRGAGIMVWGGRGLYHEIRLHQSTGTVRPFTGREDWLAGFTVSGANRPHANLGGGFIVGGIGTGHTYFALNLRMSFRFF